MTVSDIFARFGEAHFRDGERRVIATGGGAFIQDETRALILDNTLSVWLDASPEVLVARVARRDTRPLLREGDPRAILEELARVRNPIYAQAHLRIVSQHAPHDATVNAILKAIGL